MMVSSISTITWSSIPATTGVVAARPLRNLADTASSWRTWPKVNARRNEPSVEGAYALVKTLPIPPWRSTAMSSMLSAPATIPATSEATFKPAVSALVGRHTQMLIGQPAKARRPGQSQHRHQSG